MPAIPVTDNRKGATRAAAPPPNKIVASTLPTTSAPAGLGPPGAQPKGAPPPPAKVSKLLETMLTEGLEFPAGGTFEAQCYWVIARHDLGEAQKWAGDEPGSRAAFDKHLVTYRTSGKPVGFLSGASTDPGEATAAHNDNPPAVRSGNEPDSAAMVALAQVTPDPAIFTVLAPAPTPSGKNGKRWSVPKRERAAKMLAEGAQVADVATAVDMPLDAVIAYSRELGETKVVSSGASPEAPASPPATTTVVHPSGDTEEVPARAARVSVEVVVLGPPDLDALSTVLHERSRGTYVENPADVMNGAHRPFTLDELVDGFAKRLYAAQWLRKNGVK